MAQELDSEGLIHTGLQLDNPEPCQEIRHLLGYLLCGLEIYLDFHWFKLFLICPCDNY